jgi:hypothetical protein
MFGLDENFDGGEMMDSVVDRVMTDGSRRG